MAYTLKFMRYSNCGHQSAKVPQSYRFALGRMAPLAWLVLVEIVGLIYLCRVLGR